MNPVKHRYALTLLMLACLITPLLITGCGKSNDAPASAEQDQKRVERKRNSDK